MSPRVSLLALQLATTPLVIREQGRPQTPPCPPPSATGSLALSVSLSQGPGHAVYPRGCSEELKVTRAPPQTKQGCTQAPRSSGGGWGSHRVIHVSPPRCACCEGSALAGQILLGLSRLPPTAWGFGGLQALECPVLSPKVGQPHSRCSLMAVPGCPQPRAEHVGPSLRLHRTLSPGLPQVTHTWPWGPLIHAHPLLGVLDPCRAPQVCFSPVSGPGTMFLSQVLSTSPCPHILAQLQVLMP